MKRRLAASAVLAGLILTVIAPAASGSVTKGEGICDGWAEINGVRYTPANDTPGNAIPVPEEEGVLITWEGSANMPNTNGSGAIYVNVAGFLIKIDDWTTNDAVQISNGGVYQLDDFYEEVDKRVPIGRVPGIWRVDGKHEADGGECAGFALIRLEGNPLGTLLGWIVIVGLIITAGGLVIAFRARVPVRKAPTSAPEPPIAQEESVI
jgi:hypothetical protein